MKLNHTRAMIRAALEGKLDRVPTSPHPVFGIHVPREVPGVPAKVMDQRATWADPAKYDAQAAKLAAMFQKKRWSV